jgi:hypothetical protein
MNTAEYKSWIQEDGIPRPAPSTPTPKKHFRMYYHNTRIVRDRHLEMGQVASSCSALPHQHPLNTHPILCRYYGQTITIPWQVSRIGYNFGLTSPAPSPLIMAAYPRIACLECSPSMPSWITSRCRITTPGPPDQEYFSSVSTTRRQCRNLELLEVFGELIWRSAGIFVVFLWTVVGSGG